MPNVGVTQVIQQPGLGNVLGQSVSGIAQMLQQIEQFRMQQGQQDTYRRLVDEQVAAGQAGRKERARDRAEQRKMAQQQAAAYDALLTSPAIAGMFNPGELASLRALGPVEGAKQLQDLMKPVTVGGDQRLVARGPGGAPSVTLGVDTTPQLSDAPTSLREYNAARGAPLGRLPTDPTFDARDYDRWIQEQTARGAGRTSVSIASDTFASGLGKSAGDRVDRQVVAAEDAARDLQVIGQLKGLLREGMITGAGANAITSVGNALAQFGIGGDEVSDPVARTQAYQAIVGQRVGSIIKQFGSGTGLSDADRKYAERIAAGDVTLTPQALNRILDIAERQNRWVVTQANDRVNRLPVDENVRNALRVQMPAPSLPPTQQFNINGQVVTGTLDPATGRYIGTVNGRRGYLN